jgi:hypothetical protein
MLNKFFSLPRPNALLTLLGSAALVAALASPSAHAVEILGVKLDDTAKVGGKELVLSGHGIRMKAVFKVYVLGVYLTKKETTQAGVLANQGPKRFVLNFQRELSGDEFGASFLAGINKNLDKDEKSKLVNPLLKLGDTFERIGGIKKGDLVLVDWVPGTGTTMTLNGKPIMEPITEPLFNNAVLRIWYGDKPADGALKNALLGIEAPSVN